MAGYRHRISDAPRVIESGNLRFVCSGEFVAFGVGGTVVFDTEGPTTQRTIVGRDKIGDDLIAFGENEWSADVRLMPTWVDFELRGRTDPDLRCRVELRDDVPRVVEFGWRATESQDEIRQKHLRAASVDEIANLIYGLWVFELRGISRDSVGEAIRCRIGTDQERVVRGLLQDLRGGRRRVTAELLRQVAEVYRENFEQAPVEAVARVFGVKPRMAHEYVKRARDRGFLPPTTQGRKKI